MRIIIISFFIACLSLVFSLSIFTHKTNAQGAEVFATDARPVNASFIIEGVERNAIIFPSSRDSSSLGAPLVFVFHGHGGSAKNAAQKFRIHELWPEAVVAYMQGLTGIPGITDPEGKKTGWQKDPGEANDRDLKFVDVALDQILRQYRVDPSKVYALGHSNGGRFTNVIWHERDEKFAAFCSASGQGGTLIPTNTPKSILIIAGENDSLVPYTNQLLSVEATRRLLQTDPSKAVKKGFASIEPGVDGLELGTYLHPGGHEFPQKALPLAVMFFQRHTNR
ncbi:MAG: prolyl oligopeptidase family serine peptidase [Acidobacteria bacterium]|nr:prolyl oligopeptidase family serine peptidase [Acidobacteriota bacterium]